MKTRLVMVTLATLLVSACSTAPKETTAPEAASTGATATQVSPQDATTSMEQPPATGSVSSGDLATQLQEMQNKSVYFDFDSFAIKDEYHDLVQRQAELMKAHKNVVITLEGNADERGSPEYNLALGNRRANSVRKNLELLGVPNSQIQSVSFGEEKPRLSCHDEKCWGENRRVDFSGKVVN